MKELYSIYHSEIPKFITEFSKCPSLERLKDVGMNCGCEYTSLPLFSNIEKYSRYQHSIGCALIVYHFTGSIEQSLAALFHDISTPVFAHTIDFMYGDYNNQTRTENDTKKFIEQDKQLMDLLDKYNIDINDVCDYHKYPIADNDSPKLSSDRLEYSLGNMVNFGCTDIKKVEDYYNDLTVGTNEFNETELMFKDDKTACIFGIHTLMTSEIYVSNEDRYSMQMLAELMKYSIDNGVLTIDDLFTTETVVINKLLANPLTKDKWINYTKMSEVKETTKDDPSPDKRVISAKKRYIDPYIKDMGRLSNVVDEFCDKLGDYKKLDFSKILTK